MCNNVKKENNITPPVKNNSSKIFGISVSSLFFYITHIPRSKFVSNTNIVPCSWYAFSLEHHTLKCFSLNTPQKHFPRAFSYRHALPAACCDVCTIIYLISPWSFFLCSFAFRIMPLRTYLSLHLLRPQLHIGPRDEVVQ